MKVIKTKREYKNYHIGKDIRKIIEAFKQKYGEDTYISVYAAEELWKVYSENTSSCCWCNVELYSYDDIINALEPFYDVVEVDKYE